MPNDQPRQMIQLRKRAFVRIPVVQGPDNPVPQFPGIVQIVRESVEPGNRFLKGVVPVEPMEPIEMQHRIVVAGLFQPILPERVVAEFELDVEPCQIASEQGPIGIAPVPEATGRRPRLPRKKNARIAQ